MGRRSVLAGAAWALPAIAMTVSTPAFAASGVELAFDRASYSGDGCSTIAGVKVSAKENGVARSALSITVSLRDGYSFSGGAETYSSVTDGAGIMSLPAISVPVTAAKSFLTASTSGGTVSAPVSGNSVAVMGYLQGDRDGSNFSYVTVGPSLAGAAPVAKDLYLKNGSLSTGAGLNVASNISVVGQFWGNYSASWLPVQLSGGSVGYLQGDRDGANFSFVLAGSALNGARPVAKDLFILNGTIYTAAGVAVASNVEAVGQFWGNYSASWLPLRLIGGSVGYLQGDRDGSNFSFVLVGNALAGAQPIARDLFLKGSTLFTGAGSAIASNVGAAGSFWGNYSASWLPLRLTTGSVGYLQGDVDGANFSWVPVGSTLSGAVPIAKDLFLKGTTLFTAAGNAVGSNVQASGQFWGNYSASWLPIGTGSC